MRKFNFDTLFGIEPKKEPELIRFDYSYLLQPSEKIRRMKYWIGILHEAETNKDIELQKVLWKLIEDTAKINSNEINPKL